MRPPAALAVAVLVFLAGCGAMPWGDVGTSPGPPSTPRSTPTSTLPEQPTPTLHAAEKWSGGYADPEYDALGWEGGYWYNESIDVDNSDGLDDAELERVKHRVLARIELILGDELDSSELTFEFIRARSSARATTSDGRRTPSATSSGRRCSSSARTDGGPTRAPR